MGSITLIERDEEEALFIRKKGPPRGRGETKEWTRGGRHCPKKSSYSERAQQESEDEDQQDLMERRKKRGECFNCGKNGHLARDCESPRKHSEGNVATTKDIVVSGYLSEEKWDADTGITIEDDDAYFVEDLTTSDTPSFGEEEEWDMEEGFTIEMQSCNIFLSEVLLLFCYQVVPFIWFAIAMFLFYSLVPILLKISGSTMLNLSLLTSDMWAILIRVFVYHEKVDWMYYVAFAAVAVGLVIYSCVSNNDDRRGQVSEAGYAEKKLNDEEAAANAQCQGAASSCNQKSGDGKAYPVDRPVESLT
ncbi:hypothetical protein PR202_gb00793 [Eleusine coracana subsp. coracana]|uniref:CCHC-type domain-containing protein n=1 Tax=Eleusine coracana subsp. coracana TaxID=191504 RepID=A0AAV5DVS0_ELECO|nr:hypothetical protein PR202_gb00793 [Eleusine coracana subsp. coracana]